MKLCSLTFTMSFFSFSCSGLKLVIKVVYNLLGERRVFVEEILAFTEDFSNFWITVPLIVVLVHDLLINLTDEIVVSRDLKVESWLAFWETFVNFPTSKAWYSLNLQSHRDWVPWNHQVCIDDDAHLSFRRVQLCLVCYTSSERAVLHLVDNEWLKFSNVFDILSLHVLTHTEWSHAEVAALRNRPRNHEGRLLYRLERWLWLDHDLLSWKDHLLWVYRLIWMEWDRRLDTLLLVRVPHFNFLSIYPKIVKIISHLKIRKKII